MEQQQQVLTEGAKVRWSKQQAMDCLKDRHQNGQSVKDYCQAKSMESNIGLFTSFEDLVIC